MTFLETLRDWMGDSECPPIYIDWVGRSMLSACCANRVFINMHIGSREVQILPNLYTILVGPSVGYKSYSLKMVKDLMGTEKNALVEWNGRLNMVRGRTTAQGLYDAMRTKIRRTGKDGQPEIIDLPHRGQVYLISDELAADFGFGERAANMVTTLTEFYFGEPFSDRTRGNGRVYLENYSVNWLAASTPEWMRMSLTRENILSGFLGRIITVNSRPLKKRIFKSSKVNQWHTLEGILRTRLNQILAIGERFPLPFIKTEQAEALEEAWYNSKEDPEDDDVTISHWRRQQALVLKLAVNESINTGNEPNVTEPHIQRGIELVEEISRMMKDVIPSVTTNNPAAEATLMWLKIKEHVSRTDLNRYALNSHGWRADDLDKWVRTWCEGGFITADVKPPNKGGTRYSWTGKRR